MKIFPLLALLCIAMPSFAQFEKMKHQSFSTKGAEELRLSIFDEYEVEMWPGNIILIETNVKMTDATPSIFKYYIESNRYALAAKPTGTLLSLNSIDIERRPIRTKTRNCEETVKMRIFIPDNFVKIAEHYWKKSSTDKKEKEVETIEFIDDSRGL